MKRFLPGWVGQAAAQRLAARAGGLYTALKHAGNSNEPGICCSLDHINSYFFSGPHEAFHILANSIKIKAYFFEVGL